MNLADPIHRLLQAYFTGRATADQMAQLEAWLRADSSNVRALVDLSLLDGLLLADHKNKDASAVLAVLLETEEAAESIVVLAPDSAEPSHINPEAKSISWQQASSALGYLALSGMRTKAAVIAGVAALVVFTLVLTIVFSGGPKPAPVQSVQAVPGAELETVTAVATLTAERDAQWQAESRTVLPGVGDDLHAGQRLYLRSGFAEVTTARGAVAVLAGPCEIELLDRDNAIRLHTGKLVGLCYSERSKGFVVQTKHADVTDLGTEFGVEVGSKGITATVFTGEINLTPLDSEPRQLLSNQTARIKVQGDNHELIIEPQLAEEFAALRERPAVKRIPLPPTGSSAPLWQAVPDWHVVAVNGTPLDQPKPLVASRRQYQKPIPDTKAVWLEWDLANDPAGQVKGLIPYTFRTTIEIPDSIDPDRAQIVMHYSADNQLTAVRINGHERPIDGSLNLIKLPVQTAALDNHFVSGVNTIEFVVLNDQHRTHQGPGEVALIIDWHLIETPAHH